MVNLNIAHIEYSITTKSIDIFTLGCDGFCSGCCNPELKDWNIKSTSVTQAVQKIKDLNEQFDRLIDRIFIVGGDPVDGEFKSNGGVSLLIDNIQKFTNKPIYLFTRHSLEEIPVSLIQRVQYIKTGEYKPELSCDNNIQYGIKLATSNQYIVNVAEYIRSCGGIKNDNN